MIVLFVGIAIAEGLGHPSVPGDDVAVVQSAPAGLGHISKAQFGRALQQTAARSGAKTLPKPGSAQYEQLKTGAMNNLLDAVWIQGEAADLGQTATPTEIASLLKQTISQNFKTQAEFDKFRKQSHFTKADISTRIKLQILSEAIQQKVLNGLTGLQTPRSATTTTPPSPSSRSRRRATSAWCSTRTRRRSSRPRRRWRRTPPTRAGRRSPPSSPPIRPRRATEACGRASPRACSRRRWTAPCSLLRRVRSRAPSRRRSATTCSRSRRSPRPRRSR